MSALRFSLIFLVLAALTVPGCKSKGGGRPKVAVSICPVYDLVRRVAGPDADVTLVLPPGKSEQGFVPTPNDALQVSQAKLGVMVGLDLDSWMEALMRDAAPTARVLKVGDRVPTLTVKDDAGADRIDPYVWLDPQRARLMVKAIGEEMARVDASHATKYRQRANEVDASIEALDKEIEQATASWKKRAFVTPGPTFGYFAERYKLAVVASAPRVDVDPMGGGAETDSYEKLIRYDVAQLARVLATP